MVDRQIGRDRVIPRSAKPAEKPLPREAEDPLRRTVMQSTAEYLRQYSVQPQKNHQDMSKERAVQFHLLSSDSRKYAGRVAELASGFAHVSLLDEARGWAPFKSGIPQQVVQDGAVRDLLLDIACMRVRYDAWSIGNKQVEDLIRKELQTVLREFGFVPNLQQGEENTNSDKDANKPPIKTVEDVFGFIFSHPINLLPTSEP